MNREHLVEDAIVLLAGAGTRLAGGHAPIPKPLVQVLGRPLIAYVLQALESVGVHRIHAVVGANGDAVIRGIMQCLPPHITLNRIDNPHWQLQNGVSVLAAAKAVRGNFFLTMGDHLFEPAILRRLLDLAPRDHITLAVDRKLEAVFDLNDAMKVRTQEDQIVAISKELAEFDAIDTGVFLCTLELFEYVERAKVDRDCSLADGIRLLAKERKARAIDIQDAWWQDVDTPAMLARGEERLPDSLRAMFDAPVVGG